MSASAGRTSPPAPQPCRLASDPGQGGITPRPESGTTGHGTGPDQDCFCQRHDLPDHCPSWRTRPVGALGFT
jgi:hypothetical protein